MGLTRHQNSPPYLRVTFHTLALTGTAWTPAPALVPRSLSAMYSLVRIASARIVHVGFLSALRDERPAVGDEHVLHVVRLAVAVQHRAARIVAHARDPELVDDSAARLDAVAVLRAGIGDSGVPPISWMIARKVSCMCLTCLYS